MPEDFEPKRDRWRTCFREIQNEIWSDHPHQDAVPDHLYHYSSLSNIRSILSSRELWLFDVCTMQNDPSDGKYWIDVFYSVLLRKSVPKWLTDNFRPSKTLGLGSAWYSYVSCFSEDAWLKGQWEDFADRGRGCAIELSFVTFTDASNGGLGYGWTPMLYDAEDQIRRAERMVDEAIQLFRAENLTGRSERDEFWKVAPFSFLGGGTRFKDPKHWRQQEWRIFLSGNSEDKDACVSPDGRRYMRWPFPTGVVTAIIKGPNCDCPKEELERLLTAGYPANVRNAHLEGEEPVEG